MQKSTLIKGPVTSRSQVKLGHFLLSSFAGVNNNHKHLMVLVFTHITCILWAMLTQGCTVCSCGCSFAAAVADQKSLCFRHSSSRKHRGPDAPTALIPRSCLKDGSQSCFSSRLVRSTHRKNRR